MMDSGAVDEVDKGNKSSSSKVNRRRTRSSSKVSRSYPPLSFYKDSTESKMDRKICIPLSFYKTIVFYYPSLSKMDISLSNDETTLFLKKYPPLSFYFYKDSTASIPPGLRVNYIPPSSMPPTAVSKPSQPKLSFSFGSTSSDTTSSDSKSSFSFGSTSSDSKSESPPSESKSESKVSTGSQSSESKSEVTFDRFLSLSPESKSESKASIGSQSSESKSESKASIGSQSSESKSEVTFDRFLSLSPESKSELKASIGSQSSESKSESKVSTGSQSTESKSESKVSRTNSIIPDKVAFSILSKLSIKSLKRLGCLRKSWSILFENTHFMTIYSKHFISHHTSDDDYHTFVLTSHERVDGLYHSEFHLLNNKLKLNLPLQPTPFPTCILGKTSVNDIFCIGKQFPIFQNKSPYVLWNPLTEESWEVPPSPAEVTPKCPDDDMYLAHIFHGFGYDQLRDDFKVVQYVSFDFSSDSGFSSMPTRFFEIYSLKNNSWRMIHMDKDLCPRHHDYTDCWSFNGLEVYVDGACHWLVSRSFDHHPHDITVMTLLSFDLSDEVFLTTPIGEEPCSPCVPSRRLTVLNGSIALISNYHDDLVFHISILGELGVSESWTKLYMYGPLPSLQWPPIGFGKMGYMFIQKKDYQVTYFDLNTQIIEEVVTIPRRKTRDINVGLYKGSRRRISSLETFRRQPVQNLAGVLS